MSVDMALALFLVVCATSYSLATLNSWQFDFRWASYNSKKYLRRDIFINSLMTLTAVYLWWIALEQCAKCEL